MNGIRKNDPLETRRTTRMDLIERDQNRRQHLEHKVRSFVQTMYRPKLHKRQLTYLLCTLNQLKGV